MSEIINDENIEAYKSMDAIEKEVYDLLLKA